MYGSPNSGKALLLFFLSHPLQYRLFSSSSLLLLFSLQKFKVSFYFHSLQIHEVLFPSAPPTEVSHALQANGKARDDDTTFSFSSFLSSIHHWTRMDYSSTAVVSRPATQILLVRRAPSSVPNRECEVSANP